MVIQRRLLILLIMSVAILPLSSAQGVTSDYRIAALLPDSNASVFWNGVWQGVESAAQALPVRLSEYKYSTAIGSMSMESQLEKIILSSVDGILLCGNNYDNEVIGALLRKAVDDGIAVVLCDSDADPSLRAAFVGIDNSQAGRIVAERLLEEKPASIVLIDRNRDLSSKATSERMNAILAALESSSASCSVETFSGTDRECFGWVQEILVRNSGSAVVCFNSVNTLLVAQAVELLGLEEEILLAGFCEEAEAFGYVEAGVIDILAVQDNRELGERGVAVLSDILSGKAVSEINHVGIEIVTRDNLAQFSGEV